MKRILSMILILALLLSLAACGDDWDDRDDRDEDWEEPNPTPCPYDPETDIPTPEEILLLEQYESILDVLETYVQEGWAVWYVGEEKVLGPVALGFYYDQLAAMEGVDKWLEMPGFIENYQGFQPDGTAQEIDAAIVDRKTILSRFAVLEDVATLQQITRTEQDGTVKVELLPYWDYSQDGILIAENSRDPADPMLSYLGASTKPRLLTYDEAGRLHSSTCIINDTPSFTTYYVYDAQGHISRIYRDMLDGRQYEYDISCNADGLLSKVAWGERPCYERILAYDPLGRKTTDTIYNYSSPYYKDAGTWDETVYMEYTYGTGSNPVSAVYTYQDWVYRTVLGESEFYLESQSEDHYTYTYDEKGRPLKTTVDYGNEIYLREAFMHEAGSTGHVPRVKKMEINYLYGTYAFYEVPSQ